MPFTRGVSGNPSGRPRREFCLSQAIEDALMKSGKKEQVANKLVNECINGDMKAMKILFHCLLSIYALDLKYDVIDQLNDLDSRLKEIENRRSE